jgi:hypothetical protein
MLTVSKGGVIRDSCVRLQSGLVEICEIAGPCPIWHCQLKPDLYSICWTGIEHLYCHNVVRILEISTTGRRLRLSQAQHILADNRDVVADQVKLGQRLLCEDLTLERVTAIRTIRFSAPMVSLWTAGGTWFANGLLLLNNPTERNESNESDPTTDEEPAAED